MGKYKAVFFDLDDTLYDYKTSDKLAMENLYSVFNSIHPIAREEFDKIYKLAKGEVKRELAGTASSHNRILYLERLIEKTKNTVIPEDTLKLYHAYWDLLIENMKPFDGVLETMDKIKKAGMKIGIITNLTTYIQMKKIAKLGLTDLIDSLTTSEEVGVEKPHPAMFLEGMWDLGVLPQDAIMIGDDADSDIEGGNAVKMTTVQITIAGNETFNDKDDLRTANHYIDSMPELLPLLGL